MTKANGQVLPNKQSRIDCSGTSVNRSHGDALLQILDQGKHHVEGDLSALIREHSFDIVICDRIDKAIDADYLRSVEALNRGVWVTISAFGAYGPQHSQRGSELVIAAAGGLLGIVRQPQTDEPYKLAGSQAAMIVSRVAVLASLHGLNLYRTGGTQRHIDVSAQEAVLFGSLQLQCAHLLHACGGPSASYRYSAPSGVFSCVDGMVRITVVDDHQWRRAVEVLGHPEWAVAYPTVEDRRDHRLEIDRGAEEWTRERTKSECERILQEAGVPATGVNSLVDVLESPHFHQRDLFRSTRLGGLSEAVALIPHQLPMGHLSGRRKGSTGLVSGVRILDVTHVLAGPVAAALLGAMGADVVHLEDLARLDVYRRNGPFADGVAGVERGAYFAIANHSKWSVAGDLANHHNVVTKLLSQSDVLIENIGAKRLKRIGIRLDQLGTSNPDVLAVSLSGFGLTGAASHYKAYAANIQAFMGLEDSARDSAGQRLNIDTAMADYCSALFAASLIAAWALGRGRLGGHLDVAMAEVLAGNFADQFASASADLGLMREAGNDIYPHTPNNTYRTAGGQWIALSVMSDAEWEHLIGTLDQPKRLTSLDYRSAAQRWSKRNEIDKAIQSSLRRRSGSRVVRELQRSGVAAAMVETPASLIKSKHLSIRHFFQTVEHPVVGSRRILGVPWQIFGQGPIALRPAPLLGNGNAHYFDQAPDGEFSAFSDSQTG